MPQSCSDSDAEHLNGLAGFWLILMCPLCETDVTYV